MRVIFLDFDGVINNWNNFNGVDSNNVKRLLEIVNTTGAKVVATTSNKYSFQIYGIKYEDTDYFKYVNMLKQYGIDIYDVTPYVDGNRELEIMAYLKEHPDIEEFVILDDDYICKNLLDHEVFLDLYNGIMDEHLKPAIDILNGKLGFYPPNFNFSETVIERAQRINKYHSNRK